MPYFNTHGVFPLPSFGMDAEEKGKIDRFLDLLDDSGVADVISPYCCPSSLASLSIAPLVQFQPLARRHLAVFGEADLQFINHYRKKLGHKEFSSIKELERYFLGLPDLVMEFDGPVTELLFEKGTKKELESWRSKSTKEEGRNG